MKKRFLLLTAVGLGAGLLYALKGKSGARADDGTKDAEDSKSERTAKAARKGISRAGRGGNRPGLSMGRIEDGAAAVPKNESEPEIDDRGTHQAEASDILKNVRDGAFDSSDEKLALALGRPAEEIEEWTSGAGIIDGDVVMKARALAIQRGIEIE